MPADTSGFRRLDQLLVPLSSNLRIEDVMCSSSGLDLASSLFRGHHDLVKCQCEDITTARCDCWDEHVPFRRGYKAYHILADADGNLALLLELWAARKNMHIERCLLSERSTIYLDK